jgi:hypothetical protein
MKKNMGQLDKILRVLFAVVVAVLVYMDVVTGTTSVVLMILAIILLLTSLLNFCPIYRIFGWSSCKTKD